MAKIKEEILVLKLSKLVKDSATDIVDMVDDDAAANFAAVVQELVGTDVVVEIIKG